MFQNNSYNFPENKKKCVHADANFKKFKVTDTDVRIHADYPQLRMQIFVTALVLQHKTINA